MSRPAGSIVRGISKPRRISVKAGRQQGAGMYRGAGQRDKPGGTPPAAAGAHAPDLDRTKIKDLAGRSGRARTCDPRFWRPVLYQLSYTPNGGVFNQLSRGQSRTDENVG